MFIRMSDALECRIESVPAFRGGEVVGYTVKHPTEHVDILVYSMKTDVSVDTSIALSLAPTACFQ